MWGEYPLRLRICNKRKGERGRERERESIAMEMRGSRARAIIELRLLHSTLCNFIVTRERYTYIMIKCNASF